MIKTGQSSSKKYQPSNIEFDSRKKNKVKMW